MHCAQGVLVVFAAFVATAPPAAGLSAPLLPRSLPRALPTHQLHVPGAPSNHPLPAARTPPAHVFADSLRLVVCGVVDPTAEDPTAADAAHNAAVAAAATAAADDSAGANATATTRRPCVWRVYRASAEVANLEVCADGGLRTTVLDALALQEEAAGLAARAQRYFGVPADVDLAFEPLALVAALAAQQHRQQQLRLNHPQHQQQSPPSGQPPSRLALAPCDAVSKQLLATAQRLGWCDLADAAQTVAVAAGEAPAGDEVVDLVDEAGHVLGVLPRKAVHLYNCLHRGVGILVERPNDGALFVHQRSATKRIFPAMFDMFVGGVSAAGEPARLTAQRELEEELGIHTRTLAYLFDTSVSTPLNRCRVAVFRCNCALPVSPSAADPAAAELSGRSDGGIRFQASEVQGGSWEPRASVAAAAEASWAAHVLGGSKADEAAGEKGEAAGGPAPVREFVPDGLAVWNAFLEWEALQPLQL